jgi:hypothetical protein
MVRNPHLFKSINAAKYQKGGKHLMDEIEKLVNIFAKFYNEEKVKENRI